MSKSLTAAKAKLEELGYDPITALVEIAQNRNQISDLRLKAAMALLPYAYTPITTKSEVTIKDGTGVMAIPQGVSEESWSEQVAALKKRAALNQIMGEDGNDNKGLH